MSPEFNWTVVLIATVCYLVILMFYRLGKSVGRVEGTAKGFHDGRAIGYRVGYSDAMYDKEPQQ